MAMKHRNGTRIVWLGRTDTSAFDQICVDIEAARFDVETPRATEEIESAFRRASRAVAVACGGESVAQEAAGVLRSIYRPIPLVVLSQEPTTGDYYRLVSGGPTYYCGELEEPGKIARAIRRAAAQAA